MKCFAAATMHARLAPRDLASAPPKAGAERQRTSTNRLVALDSR